MSAAEKAIAALEAAGKAATPRPWRRGMPACDCADDVADGETSVMLPGGECIVPHASDDNANLIFHSVNLSSPLAAVARAAMARPWKSGAICVMCGGIQAAFGGKIEHVDECQFGDLDAALDALEAAAEGVL